jgi:hypothetical protein
LILPLQVSDDTREKASDIVSNIALIVAGMGVFWDFDTW